MGFFVPWLVDAARLATQGTGCQVIVQHDWKTRGHGGLRVCEFVIGHHTATSESSPGDYPSYNIVTYGRSDLSGPLANFGLGRSGNVYVIGAGIAYHAGASYYAGYYDLNDESLGIEAEDSGDGKWTDAQLFMYPRLVNACLQYMKRGVDRYASHRTVATPAGRKPDPAGISDDWMRQQASIPLEDLMTPLDIENACYKAVTNLAVDAASGNPAATVAASYRTALRTLLDADATQSKLDALQAEVDRLAAIVTGQGYVLKPTGEITVVAEPLPGETKDGIETRVS